MRYLTQQLQWCCVNLNSPTHLGLLVRHCTPAGLTEEWMLSSPLPLPLLPCPPLSTSPHFHHRPSPPCPLSSCLLIYPPPLCGCRPSAHRAAPCSSSPPARSLGNPAGQTPRPSLIPRQACKTKKRQEKYWETGEKSDGARYECALCQVQQVEC